MRLEYVWIDCDNQLHSKVRVMKFLNETDTSQYDGCFSNDITHKEIQLVPKKLIQNPFHKDEYLVLCDTYIHNEDNELLPHYSNTRHFCQKEFRLHPKGVEFEFQQDFYIMDSETRKPYGKSFGLSDNKNYCKVGNGYIHGREIINTVFTYCENVDIHIHEVCSQNGPSQWTVSVKGVDIDAADQLVLFRYILSRVCEEYNTYPSFEPIPFPGLYPSGLRVQFSTDKMRGNYESVQLVIKNLAKHHERSLSCYGDNSQRLSNFHLSQFTFGISKKDVSLVVPHETFQSKKGSVIDTRPASDANPYVVSQSLMEIIHDTI